MTFRIGSFPPFAGAALARPVRGRGDSPARMGVRPASLTGKEPGA